MTPVRSGRAHSSPKTSARIRVLNTAEETRDVRSLHLASVLTLECRSEREKKPTHRRRRRRDWRPRPTPALAIDPLTRACRSPRTSSPSSRAGISCIISTRRELHPEGAAIPPPRRLRRPGSQNILHTKIRPRTTHNRLCPISPESPPCSVPPPSQKTAPDGTPTQSAHPAFQSGRQVFGSATRASARVASRSSPSGA